MKRECPTCHKIFETNCGKVYCSPECRKPAKRASGRKHYAQHKEECIARATKYHFNQGRICPICGVAISNTAQSCRKHLINRPSGENHPQWNGGKWQSRTKGYVYVSIGNGKYRPEHQLVWEEANGKPLPEGYVIHHLNGIRSDNRPENLMAMPLKAHSKILGRNGIAQTRLFIKALQRRIRELEQLRLV